MKRREDLEMASWTQTIAVTITQHRCYQKHIAPGTGTDLESVQSYVRGGLMHKI